MTEKQKKRITVYDIAKQSGVSQSTVSKVLNDYPGIKETTRDKVMHTIKELNFRPDALARSLAINKTNSIGLIVGDITNPFYSESAKVIMEEAKKAGYGVILYNSGDEKISESIRNLLDRRVDGVLISSIGIKDPIPRDLLERKFPIVLFNQINQHSKGVSTVSVDDTVGIRIAMDYLIERGHANIAYISGPLDRSTYRNRMTGFESYVAASPIKFHKELVRVISLETPSLDQIICELLGFQHKPSAIFASSDAIALSILASLHNLGLQVPDDISVMGYGNIAITSNPLINLTTVAQRVEDTAKLALSHLLDAIDDENRIVQHVLIEPHLVVRGTVSHK